MLEIGFGTGLNVPHYPSHVEKLAVVFVLLISQNFTKKTYRDWVRTSIAEEPLKNEIYALRASRLALQVPR